MSPFCGFFKKGVLFFCCVSSIFMIGSETSITQLKTKGGNIHCRRAEGCDCPGKLFCGTAEENNINNQAG